MMVAPDSLKDRYYVEFFGDDIAWLRVDEGDGKIYAMNPENGVFGVAKDTNEGSNPNAIESIQPGSGALFTNVAYNQNTQQTWWEGRTPDYPADRHGLVRLARRAHRRPPGRQAALQGGGDEWSHPNSRFTTALTNVPNASPDAVDPKGVPIDAIIFGGRVKDREPLVRAVDDLAEGVYDGLTLGAEATFAADGKQGIMRYDPMSMRPFMSYSEGEYAAHWIKVLSETTDMPVFAHVNWFQRDADGRYIWPGYGENLRALLWLIDLKEGRAKGKRTAIGILPERSELMLDGLEINDADLTRLLSFDTELWRLEVQQREEHLKQFPNLPDAIWAAHRRLAERLAEEGASPK